MLEGTDFYNEIIQGLDSKLAVVAENETILTEQAGLLRREYENRKAEMDRIVAEICDERVKKVYERVGAMITTQRRLWSVLINSRISAREEDEQAEQREINDLILEELEAVEKIYCENSEYIDRIEDDWRGVKKASIEGVKLSREIDWGSIPEEELAKRLRGGEVLHRDEWIPGKDSDSGRKLSAGELKSHMEFGEMILKEGKDAFERQDYELSFTRYTQGVELLCWVRGAEEESELLRLEMYKKFLKNQALLALKLGKYNDSIQSCNKVLKIDDCDEKSIFRRGECFLMLGRFEEAKKDFRFICEFDYFSRDAKAQSRKKLVEIMKRSKSNNKVSKGIIGRLDGLMQENRDSGRTSAPEEASQALQPPYSPRVSGPPGAVLQTPHSGNDGPSHSSTSTPKREIEPHFDLETTKDILEELLFRYSSEEFEKQLFQLRKLSDYDEKRLLRRLKNVLPEVNIPVFQKHGLDLESMSYEKARRTVEESVFYWRTRDSQVKTLSKEIYKHIMGDTLVE
ncbi:TPR repeat-containing protein [Cryptosporidium felis]|nr:TPR repeat-containing protein [Cryptosporidium felis]